MCFCSCGPREYNHGCCGYGSANPAWMCPSCSSIPWLYSWGHMNEHTLLNNIILGLYILILLQMNTSQLGAHCTVTIEIWGMPRLELEGLRDLGSWNGEQTYMESYCMTKFHGSSEFVSSLPQRGGSNNKTRRPWHFKFSPHLIYYNLLYRRAHMNRMVYEIAFGFETNCVRHSTTLEGLWPQKLSSNFPWYGFQMSFKGPHNVMVTTLGHT